MEKITLDPETMNAVSPLLPVPIDHSATSEALDDVGKIHLKINRLSEHALAQRVEFAEDLPNAMLMIDQLKEFRSTMDSLIELFREPAYAHYQRVLAQKKALLAPVEDSIEHLRDEIQHWKAEADRKLLAAKEEFAGDATDETAEALHRATEASEAEVEGLGYRTYWKAECVDLKALCAAIGAGDAPTTLVTFNQSGGNTLARSLRNVMKYPGVRVYSEKRPVLK